MFQTPQVGPALNLITLKGQPQPRILIVQLHLTICHGSLFFTTRNGSLQLHNARQVRGPTCYICQRFREDWLRLDTAIAEPRFP